MAERRLSQGDFRTVYPHVVPRPRWKTWLNVAPPLAPCYRSRHLRQAAV